jgi:hypothetical protein
MTPMEYTCALPINHLDRNIPTTINNFNNVPIGFCIINHGSFEIRFWKLMLQHCFIELCPHKSLSFRIFKLHIINNYGQHFTIERIIHMTSHYCPANNMFHIIKHGPNVLQIPCRLHSCDEANSTPVTIY